VGPVEGSLYDRLGGVDAITAVARAFDERAGKDDRINQKFARTNLERLTNLGLSPGISRANDLK